MKTTHLKTMHPLFTTWILATLILCTMGCSETASIPTIEPPAPDLTSLETPVANALARAREDVLASPERGSAWGAYGLTLQAHDLYEEAAACYNQASRLAPGDDRWPYLTGLVLRNLDLDRALEAFAQAEALRPRHAAFFVRYGDVLLEAGQGPAAGLRFQQALELNGASPFARFGLARVALLTGDLEAAHQHLQSALGQQAAYREAQTLMAQVEQRLGNPEAAKLHTWKAANYDDSTAMPDPLFEQVSAAGRSSVWAARRGLAAAKTGKYVEAVQHFRQVLDIRGDNATDLAYYGGALYGARRIDEAMQAYDRALELDPQSVVTLNNVGQAHLHQGDLDTAAVYLSRALEQDPGNREAGLNLALIYGRQGRLEESSRHLENLLQQAPGDVQILQMMAPLLQEMGQQDEALDLWRRLVDVQPHQLEALEQVARLLVQQHHHGEAIERLRGGLDVAPNSSRLALFLAWELATAPAAELRDGLEAVRLATRVRQAYPEQYQPADVLAAAHAENGDYAQAGREIQQAIELARRAEAPVISELEARRQGYAAGRPHRQGQDTEK